MKKLLYTFLLVFTICNGCFAQQQELLYSGFFDSYYYRGFNFTLSGGATAYRGDLSANLATNTLGMTFGAGAHYRLWPRVVLGAEFNYFTLRATDDFAERNMSFSSVNYEVLAIGKFFIVDDIVRVARDRNKKPRLSKPYITAGVGFLSFSPVSSYMDPVPANANFRPERGYPGYTLVVPAGLGVAFYLTPHFSVLPEISYRFTFTDHLDDVSFRGNPDRNDGYAFFNLKLQYTLNPPNYKKKRRSSKTIPPAHEGGGERSSPPPAKKDKDADDSGDDDNGGWTEPVPDPEPEPEEEEYYYEGWD